MEQESELRRLRAENQTLRQECRRNRRQELMEHLLRGEYNTPETIAADLRAVGVELKKSSFVEVYVNVLTMPAAPESGADRSLGPDASFRVVYEDGLAERVRLAYPKDYCGAARWGTGIIALLQMDREQPEPLPPAGQDREHLDRPPDGSFIDDLNKKALDLADSLAAEQGLEVFIAISRPHEGIDGIPKAHQEIQRIDNYRTVMGIDVPLLCYHDFEVAERERLSGTGVLQLERAYLTSVELGEFEQARRTLQRLIDLEFRRGVPQLDTLSAKLSAKLELLLLALERFRTGNDPSVYEMLLTLQTDLSQNMLTVAELRRKIDEIFGQLAALESQRQAPKWMNMLLGYVEENYTNTELNVASISETFGLNPSYLSREVKRCTGSGLLDLLQRKRLERAVALLGSGESMAGAARESGFGDVRSLRRAIKKYGPA